jgi:hypothetical protein
LRAKALFLAFRKFQHRRAGVDKTVIINFFAWALDILYCMINSDSLRFVVFIRYLKNGTVFEKRGKNSTPIADKLKI